MRNPDIAKACENAGKEYDKTEYKVAKAIYHSAIENPYFKDESKSDQARTWYNYAHACRMVNNEIKNVHEKIKNAGEVILGFNKWLELKKDNNAEVLLYLAQMYLLRGWCVLDNKKDGSEKTKKEALYEIMNDLFASRQNFANLPPYQKMLDEYKKNYRGKDEDLKDSTEALKLLYQQCIAGIEDLERNLLSMMADFAFDRKEYRQAISHYRDAVILLEKIISQQQVKDIADKNLLADHFHNMADCYCALGDKDNAIMYFSFCLPLYQQVAQTSSVLAEAARESAQSVSWNLLHYDLYCNRDTHPRTDGSQRPIDQVRRTPSSLNPAVKRMKNSPGDEQDNDHLVADTPLNPKSRQELMRMSKNQLKEYLARLQNEHVLKYKLNESLTEVERQVPSVRS